MHVIINGVSSETLQGVQVLSLPPITKPRMRTSVAVIDGRPGDIVTRLGYEAYNRKIRILLHHDYDIDAISAFFNTSGTIIFSNEPDMEYEFETIDAFSFERAVRYKTADITFHVQPYKLSATEEPATGEVSTLVDKTPYIIRRTPFGTRQKGTIVGGSIVWNQLINATNVSTQTKDGVTYTNNGDGSFTLSGTPTDNNCFLNIDYKAGTNPYLTGHVYLADSGYRGDLNVGIRIYGLNGSGSSISSYNRPAIVKAADTSGAGYARFQVYGYQGMDIGSIKLTPQLFDITLMLGPTIADYIYAQEQASTGAGVALAKAWAGIIADYYPHDAGSIKSVEGLVSHKMTGKNLVEIGEWTSVTNAGITATNNGDGSITINGTASSTTIPVGNLYLGTAGPASEQNDHKKHIPNGRYLCTTGVSANQGVGFQIAGSNGSTISIIKGMYVSAEVDIDDTYQHNWIRIVVAAGTYNNVTIYPMIRYADVQDATFEPYTAHTYPLDSSLTLRGLLKLDGGNLSYDGDIYKADGTVERRYGVVDLGTLTWSASGASFASNTFSSQSIPTKAYGNVNFVANGYTATDSAYLEMQDKTIRGNATGKRVFIRDTAYTDTTAFKTAMSGVYLVYELDEPTTEQAEPYTSLQICDPAGTEEWVGASMPVGHETTYIDPISMTVTNEGNTESAPSITIEGEGAVEVTVDGLNILQIQMPASGEITIDSRTLDATDGEGGLANRSVTGDYNDLCLAPGEHTVTVTGDVTSVTLKNTSRWI